jgi:hypothetical protein
VLETLHHVALQLLFTAVITSFERNQRVAASHVLFSLAALLLFWPCCADVLLLLLPLCLVPDPGAVDDDVPEALFNELALTVLQQSTLCPLPLAVQPVHWAHEQVRVESDAYMMMCYGG